MERQSEVTAAQQFDIFRNFLDDQPSSKKKTIDIHYYLGLIWRRWLFISMIFCTAMILGIYLAISLPKIYQAETLIFIDPPGVPDEYVRSIIPVDLNVRLSNINQMITSQTNFINIIERFELFSEPEYENMFIQDKIEKMRELTLVKLITNRGRTSNAFTISFKGGDPHKVMNVVNAMATLGGHVMIYRGLLEKIPNENTLVMLLGHEIGHIKLRHPVKALGKGVVFGLLLSTVLGQSSDSVANVLTDTSMLTMLSFNREQEEDADDEGLKVMNAYYRHVQFSTELFEILKNEQQGNGLDVPQFLSSHPDTEHRIQHLNELTHTQHWIQQGIIRPIPGTITKKLADDKQKTEEVLKKEKE
jgi:Zn-dependent protease with chaperone function